MPIPNLENVKIGDTTIDKIYVGDDLVYSHDKPVWLLRMPKSIRYSLDGINYTTMQSWNSAELFEGACYTTGKLWFARNDSANLWVQNSADVAKGIYSVTGVATGSSDGYLGMDSDGENVILCKPKTSTSTFYYSLDGGTTWATKNMDTTGGTRPKQINYLGDGRFFVNLDKAEESANLGKYYYWRSTSPTTYYHIDTGAGKQVKYVQRCNDPYKYYYITNTTGTYRCTNMSTLGTLISAFSTYIPSCFTYVYGKYYCICDQKLYSSTDGLNFTRVTISDLSGTYYQEIIKSNNKLVFISAGLYTNNLYVGIIDKDNNVTYTHLTDYNQGSSNAYGVKNFATNRFPKL